MRKFLAYLLGIIDLLPLVFVLYLIIHVFSVYDPPASTMTHPENILPVKWLIDTHTFLIISLLIVHLCYLHLTEFVPKGKRKLWFVVLLALNIFSFPVFWYYYVWNPLIKQTKPNIRLEQTAGK
jgi:hypothetical protein